MDCFYEQFLGKDYGVKAKRFELLRETLIMAAILGSVFIGVAFGLIVFFLYLILGVVGKNIFLEYEYELTEDELVISKILNKKARKKITTININEVVDVTKEDMAIKQGAKIINASFKDDKGNKQIIYINKDGKLIGFRVSMDSKLIYNCKRINRLSFNNL